jgi:hypothetical protein
MQRATAGSVMVPIREHGGVSLRGPLLGKLIATHRAADNGDYLSGPDGAA